MYGAWDLSILAMMYHLQDYAGECWSRVGACLGTGVGVGEACGEVTYVIRQGGQFRRPIADMGQRSKHTIR